MRRFWFLLLLLLSLCILFIGQNISYCAMSQSCKEDIISKLDKLNDNDLFNDQTYDYLVSYINTANRWNDNSLGDNYFIMIAKGSRFNGGGHNWGKMSSTLSIYICPVANQYTTITNYTSSQTNTGYTDWNSSYSGVSCACFSTSNRYSGNFHYGDAIDGFYIYTTVPINTRLLQLGANEEYGGFYVNNDLRFTPFNNNIQTIGGVSNIHVENFSRSVYEWRLGTLTNFDSYTTGVLEMYQGENSQWLPINGVMGWNSNGEVYLRNNNILYYQLYRVSFYDRDYNYTDTYGYYFLPIGATYSGEGLIYNGNDNNNSSPVISQLEENQSFWEATYNNLFNMNSGDYTEIYGLVSSYFPSGDTPITIYETIFGGLNNEPDDFIIRWDDVPLNITWFNGQSLYSGDFIKASSINISKTCRDDPVLSQIKFWLNTFVVIGFLTLFYHTLYNCICHVLGVVSEDTVVENDNYKRNDIGFKM